MKIIVAAHKEQRNALENLRPGSETVWIDDPKAFNSYKDADAFLDLTFVNEKSRIELLRGLLPKPVIINSVVARLSDTDERFTRINGWDSFLNAPVIEGSCLDPVQKQGAEGVFDSFGKKVEWVPDVTGFITPRVVSMIINEAFFALEEAVSTKEEINIAMKLGTNYPFGPFEWAEKIGIKNVDHLLQTLAAENSRYSPAPALAWAATNQQTVK
jgi:3-hydroxybutyryl-CoA dehydrogenase